ncbi:hypothetical protein R1X32_11460 (plasmid) [Rhodococcus opacus]
MLDGILGQRVHHCEKLEKLDRTLVESPEADVDHLTDPCRSIQLTLETPGAFRERQPFALEGTAEELAQQQWISFAGLVQLAGQGTVDLAVQRVLGKCVGLGAFERPEGE